MPIGGEIATLLSLAQLPHSFAVSLPDPSGSALGFTLTGVIESESVEVVLHCYIRHYLRVKRKGKTRF